MPEWAEPVIPILHGQAASRMRRRPSKTSFWYVTRYGTADFAKAGTYLKTENDGRVIIPGAKGVRTKTFPRPPKFETFKEEDGSKIKADAKWTDIKQPPPPMQVSDLHGWTADIMMRRSKEAALICDHAQIEAWKQADIARYWTRQAQAFEAAAMRALRHAQPGNSFEPEPPLNMNEYPIAPENHWQRQMLSPPPGWESPGAVQNPLHSPAPSNEFTLHASPSEPAPHEAKKALTVLSGFPASPIKLLATLAVFQVMSDNRKAKTVLSGFL